jgi:hypothetical protein
VAPRPNRRPLDGVRRTLGTRLRVLSSRSPTRLEAVFSNDAHLACRWPGAFTGASSPPTTTPIGVAQDSDDRDHRITSAAACLPWLRNWHSWAAPCGNAAGLHPCGNAAPTSWPSWITTPTTDPPKPSMAAWKQCAATPSASAISPTTAGDHSFTAAHSAHSSMHSELRTACRTRDPSLSFSEATLDHSVTAAKARLPRGWAVKAKEFQPSSRTGRVPDRIEYREGGPAVQGF